MKPSFDIRGYLASKSIPYILEGKNVQTGWLGTRCPFCNDRSTHLGINMQSFAFNCWRCNETGTIFKFVAQVEGNVGWGHVRQIVSEFSSQEFQTFIRQDVTRPTREFVPPRIEPINRSGYHYLRHTRNFPPKLLIDKYRIAMFPPTSFYKFRIYIPLYHGGRLVSFTTRAIKPKMEPKYLHYPKRSSVMFAKETLYNLDNSVGDTVIVVEGPIDAWRIGDGCVATFGMVYTQAQIKLIRSRFKRVFVMYDAEKQAQIQADKLAADLSAFNLEVNILKITNGDPGGMNLADVRSLRREIFKG